VYDKAHHRLSKSVMTTVLCSVRDKWGPRHHGVARLQAADGETASSMEGSCEYIE